MPSLAEQLLEYETKLLDPLLRRRPDALASLLAEDFLEFASSGRTYDKKQVLYRISRHVPAHLTIEEFRVVELAPTIALATYRARTESTEKKGERYSLRSSLWVQRAEAWKIVFHQGTLISDNRPLEKFSFPIASKLAGI